MTLYSREVMERDLVDTFGIPGLDGYLKQVDQLLAQVTHSSNILLQKPLERLTKNTGKKLRASLVIAASGETKMTGNILAAATSIELLHLASLIHDDIIDAASTRRDVVTINQKEGSSTAILVGDYVLAGAMSQAAMISSAAVELLASTFAEMCAGQASELSDLGNPNRTLAAYYEVIDQKTAVLMSASCVMGSLVSKQSQTNDTVLAKFGKNFGMAYQLIDDVLDFLSSKQLSRKPIGIDLKSGVYTMPLIITLQKFDTPAQKQLLAQPVEIVADELLANGSITKTLTKIRKHNRAAAQAVTKQYSHLSNLPEAYFNWALSSQVDSRYRGTLSS